MKKENKLLIKIKRLLDSIGCPKFLHRVGPKKYQLKHHVLALITTEAFHLSLRRVENLLEMFGVKVPTFFASCKQRKKRLSWIWQNMMRITAWLKYESVVIDATGFSRINPSYHFIKRVDRINLVKGHAKSLNFICESNPYMNQRHKETFNKM